MRFLLALLLAAAWIPGSLSVWSPPDDQDSSGDDLEISGSGSGDDDLIQMGVAPSSTSSSHTTLVSPTTELKQVLLHGPERAVTSQAPPTTAAGVVVTAHQTAGAPAQGSVETEDHLHGQTTSASPNVHDEHSTSSPTKVQPRAGEGIHSKMATTPSHSTTIPTSTVMRANTTVVKLEHTPTKKTHPAPTAVAPSQDKVPSITEHVPTSGVLATTPTLLPTMLEETIGKEGRSHVGSEVEKDNDIVLDPEHSSQSQSLLDRKEVLAGVITGGVVGLAFAVLLVSLMVYRMKKKDEGSYSLDEHNHPNVGYQRPQAQEEFLA